MELKGQWLRPWADEALLGLVVAIEGELAVCRTGGGFEFCVRLADVKAGRAALFQSPAEILWRGSLDLRAAGAMETDNPRATAALSEILRLRAAS